jgi:phosphotriesterase-related protein
MLSLNRRQFIKTSTLASGFVLAGAPQMAGKDRVVETGQVMTVKGPISENALGVCLHHEHIVSRFGEPPEDLPSYNYDSALSEIVPYLKYMKSLGCDSIMCCTTKYFGRDAKLLQKVSEASGMQIIANTGFYGAANDRYVPEFAYSMKPQEIAEIWIDEFENGIDNSSIRPGFIKVGIDGGTLSDIDAKLVHAGAICHKATGLTLQVHTGDNLDAVKKQLTILENEGVSPDAWVWIHAQNVKNPDDLLYAAGKGAWISLDALRTANYYENRSDINISVERHLELLDHLKKHGFLEQVLIAHDGSSYPQQGKSKRTFEVLFTTFIPMLRTAGFSDEEIDQLIRTNPENAYTIRKRLI